MVQHDHQPMALAGVKVLDLSRILAGPYATQLFADLGADVVKVENPDGGDDTRRWGPPFTTKADGGRGDAAYFSACNRNKRSITVDFASKAGADLLRDLAAKADIIVENFRPGGLQNKPTTRIAPRLHLLHLTACQSRTMHSVRPRVSRCLQCRGTADHSLNLLNLSNHIILDRNLSFTVQGGGTTWTTCSTGWAGASPRRSGRRCAWFQSPGTTRTSTTRGRPTSASRYASGVPPPDACQYPALWRPVSLLRRGFRRRSCCTARSTTCGGSAHPLKATRSVSCAAVSSLCIAPSALATAASSFELIAPRSSPRSLSILIFLFVFSLSIS